MTSLSSAKSARPTMVDVAARAGVSVKTVSRVVNDEPGVREDTQRKVNAAIKALGFQRNDGARQLRRGRTSTIGLILEDLANPFYSQLTAAVEAEARLYDHLLISASAEGSPDLEASLLAALSARRVDGLVVVPAPRVHPGAAFPAEEAALTVPVVLVDRPVPGARADTVLSDNEGGIRSAVEHLVAHGHLRVGFLGDDATFWTAERRREAFVRTVQALALPGPPHVAMGPQTVDTLVEVLRTWTSEPEPVTAVVTGNNRITVGALHAMRHLDIVLALVGYDDFELADVLDPPVTVVHQDPALLGQRACQLLFARIAGDESPPRTVVVPTRLIVRGSGTIRAGPGAGRSTDHGPARSSRPGQERRHRSPPSTVTQGGLTPTDAPSSR